MPLALVVNNQRDDDEDDELGLAALVRRFEESEEATFDARKLAERDRRYVDGEQLDEEQLAELSKRGQPAVIINRIKSKIDFLVGFEKQQRTKPRALPRTPQHEQDAEACSDALNFVVDDSDFKMTRSAVWRNMLVEGTGAVEVCVKGYDDGYKGDANEICIEVTRFRWDRFFCDPHSLELDFSDAAYLGGVWWMDHADAVARWPDKEEELDATIADVNYSDTFGDKPEWQIWADRKRKRVRVCQIWIRRKGKNADEWHFAEFVKNGILNEGPSPYVTDDGDSDCGLIAQSAYVDQNGDRYGVVRQFISPQDEINKRRSKALHLLNSNQILYEEGAVDNIETTRSEAARPDGTIKVAPGALTNQQFQFRERVDLAKAHVELLQEAKSEIDLMGPNAAMQGDQGDGSASGRAIMASQQGGAIEMGDLLDNLRYFDKRVYRAIWNRIRQYWTAEKWIRITDDERNVRFAAINKPAMIQIPHPTMPGQVLELPDIDPATGQQRIENNVAQAQVDIYIDDVSDVVAPQIEQWQALVELKKVDVNNELSFEDLIKAAPNIRNKDQILEGMAQRKQQAAQQGPPPDPHQQALQAKAQEMQLQAQHDAQADQRKLAHADMTHKQKLTQSAQEHQLKLDLQEREAQVSERIEVGKAKVQAATQAHLAAEKQKHEIVGEARKQEVGAFYEGQRAKQGLEIEGQRHKQSLQADGERESLKQRSEKQKMVAQHEATQAKAKPDAGGDVAARFERQFAAMAKAMDSLHKTIKAADDGNKQHRAIVAQELQRVRQAREQRVTTGGKG
jgi:hypothetical protein